MHRVVIKMPACFRWTPEALTGASVAAILARHVPAPACEDILVRQDQSATAMIHESVLPKLNAMQRQRWGVFQNTCHLKLLPRNAHALALRGRQS